MNNNIPTLEIVYRDIPDEWKKIKNSYRMLCVSDGFIEAPIGETIILKNKFVKKNVAIKIIECEQERFNECGQHLEPCHCENCFLAYTEFCDCMLCVPNKRKDKKNVHFAITAPIETKNKPTIEISYKYIPNKWKNVKDGESPFVGDFSETDCFIEVPVEKEIIIKNVCSKKNVILKAVENESKYPMFCDDCALMNSEFCNCFHCGSGNRKDKKDVHFEKVEKGE